MSQLLLSSIIAAVGVGAILGATAYCIYFERKIAAWVQDRCGPNRLGPWGVFQPIADGLKFVWKEDSFPQHVDKVLFVLAPAISFVVALVTFAAIPWGGQLRWGDAVYDIQVASPDIGLLYILGVASLAVYGVVLGGWASNNKYSFFGAMRSCAQMLSYEIPLGMCILVVVLAMGTLRLEEITAQQTGYWLGVIPQWNIFLHPLAFLLLFVCSLAESNRAPFDLAEAEQELVGGFHTEYGALKFGLFFLGEYAHMITASALMAVLFFGGWHFPWVPWTQPEAMGVVAVLAKVAVLSAKVVVALFVMMWIRWTLPRFRYDQLMSLAWQGLIPMTLGLVVWATLLLYWQMPRSPLLALAGNAVVLGIALTLAARAPRGVSGRQAGLPPIPTAGER